MMNYRRLSSDGQWLLIAGLAILAMPGCYPAERSLSSSVATRNTPGSFVNSIGIEFVRIPAGQFVMGAEARSPVGGKNTPQHLVRIDRPFYIGKFEVTHEQFRLLTGPYWTVPPMFYLDVEDTDSSPSASLSQFPADNVSWNAAQGFCRKLSELPEEKAAGRNYRLPTEAEWEYVCRAGSSTAYCFGDDIDLSEANFNAFPSGEAKKPLGRTAKVGSYPPNLFGVYDMHGNVWEWCFGGMEEYRAGTRTNPTGELAIYEVLRGGAWDFPKQFCRSDFRTAGFGGYVFVGFRIVCEITQPDVAKKR